MRVWKNQETSFVAKLGIGARLEIEVVQAVACKSHSDGKGNPFLWQLFWGRDGSTTPEFRLAALQLRSA